MTIYPKYRQVADQLIEQIQSRTFAIGTTLPNEAELCTRFDVSRNTIREALGLIERLGMIERRTRRGTTVISETPTRSNVELVGTLDHLVRHTPSFPLAIDAIDQVQLPATKNSEKGPSLATWPRLTGRWFAKGDVIPIGSSDIFVHPTYADALDAAKAAGKIDNSVIDLKYWNAVQMVRHDIEAVVLDNSTAQPLLVGPGTPALMVTRRYFDENDEVIEIAICRFPIGRYSYSTSFSRPVRTPD